MNEAYEKLMRVGASAGYTKAAFTQLLVDATADGVPAVSVGLPPPLPRCELQSILNVTYELPNDVDEELLRETLHDAITTVYQQGGFVGDTGAFVVTWHNDARTRGSYDPMVDGVVYNLDHKEYEEAAKHLGDLFKYVVDKINKQMPDTARPLTLLGLFEHFVLNAKTEEADDA